MSTLPPRPLIEELELQASDEIKLYLELIRVLERDIDDIKAGNTRNGWTSWALIGGIVGSLLFLFDETRKLQTFPAEQVKITILAGLLFYEVAKLSLRVFSLDQTGIKPGRIRWSKDVNFSYVPTGIYTLLIYITLIFILFTLTLPLAIKIIALVTLILSTVLTVLVLVLSRMKFPLGNNKISKRSAFGSFFLIYSLSVLTLILLGTQMLFPLGETATLPYILSGLILAIIVLIGYLIPMMAPSRLLTNLDDLRHDIIFLRADIDEALQRYQVLTEGETLPDALKEDLSEILSHIGNIEYAHSNMNTLLEKMSKELPAKDDSPELRGYKQRQLILDRDSYALHAARCSEISTPLKVKLQELNKRLSRLSAVSEDWAGENYIRSFLSQRLQAIDISETQLNQNIQALDYYIQNPDKIPQQTHISPNIKKTRRRRQQNNQAETDQPKKNEAS